MRIDEEGKILAAVRLFGEYGTECSRVIERAVESGDLDLDVFEEFVAQVTDLDSTVERS